MNEKQKTNLQELIIGIMAAALVFSLARIGRLENEIDQLENSLNSQYHMLTTQVESIYTSVDQMLKEGKSEKEILEYLEMESESIRDATDNDSTGLHLFPGNSRPAVLFRYNVPHPVGIDGDRVCQRCEVDGGAI